MKYDVSNNCIDMIYQIKAYVSSYISKAYELIRNICSKTIVINGFVSKNTFSFNKYNFGDDINVPLLEAITGKRVSVLGSHFFQSTKENLLCIGSIIEYYCNTNSIIWGSGALMGIESMKIKPKKVCAVRGSFTRNYLLANGIECPEVYGDPALLLPLIYDNDVQKEYKIGLIPHIIDADLDIVKQICLENTSVHVIHFNNYVSWQDVIDEIKKCECVISSSLHGLIISDAYGIANVRVKFSDSIKGGDFKYKDYYSGVNRFYQEPLDWRYNYCLQDAIERIKIYKPICFNPIPLLKAFPYILSESFVISLKSKRITI